MYLYMSYEILIYWGLWTHFSSMLLLVWQWFFLFVLFFCFHFYLFFKPKWFYQYLLSISINVFNLINFTKLCRLLATIVNTQETFKSGLNVVLGWYEVTTSDKVQLTLKQRSVYQHWRTSNQRCLFRRWY